MLAGIGQAPVRKSRALDSAATMLVQIILAATATSETERIKGAFFGALVADALCLGSHYEYDAPTIKRAYGGTLTTYMGPGEQMGGTTHGVGWGLGCR